MPALGVPAQLLFRRPDLRREERALAAAHARLGAAEAERLPRVTLSGSISLQGPDLGDVIRPEAFLLQAGPGISLPLFQGGRLTGRILQAESRQRQALLRLRASVLEALSEVETAGMRRVQAEERITRLSAAVTAAQTAEDLATSRYNAGQVDFLVVTESRRARLALDRTRVTAERDALLRLVNLYAALGGGWDERSSQTDPSSQRALHDARGTESTANGRGDQG